VLISIDKKNELKIVAQTNFEKQYLTRIRHNVIDFNANEKFVSELCLVEDKHKDKIKLLITRTDGQYFVDSIECSKSDSKFIDDLRDFIDNYKR